MANKGSDGRGATPRRTNTTGFTLATRRAVLELSGAVGYGNVTVAAILERSGSNRSRFYTTFGGKEDCYTTAHGEAADRLVSRLLDGCETRDWRSGMREALVELARFTAEDADLAAGLIAEVHGAGGAALVKRNEVLERLSRAVDGARRDTKGSRHSPPPVTSRFIVEAIESTVIRTLLERDRLAEEIPGLLYIAVACYFGTTAARREATKLGSLS
jgi:AcrR family transcriptional regulator